MINYYILPYLTTFYIFFFILKLPIAVGQWAAKHMHIMFVFTQRYPQKIKTLGVQESPTAERTLPFSNETTVDSTAAFTIVEIGCSQAKSEKGKTK